MAFSTAQRPILHEVFRQQEDRGTRYEPLLMKLFPPETRPRQREVLIEIYRKGKIAEAFRAFRKIYLEIVDEVIDHLKSHEANGFLCEELAKRSEFNSDKLLPLADIDGKGWICYYNCY